MSDTALLPATSTDLEKAIVGASGLSGLNPEIIATLWNPNTCPATALPWFAWGLSVDEWDANWDEATQRRVIAASIDIHRHKGTVAAVRRALTALGHTGHLIEWWQQSPPGQPHTFLADVEVDSRGIDIATQIEIERQIIAVKPVRSHFAMRLISSSYCGARIANAVLTGEDITVLPYTIEEADAPAPSLHIGIGVQAWGTATIYPQGT